MPAWWLIPAGLQAVGAISNYSSGKSQNRNQLAVNKYNATAQYNTTMGNIQSQTMLAGVNAAMMNAQAGMLAGIAGKQAAAGREQAQLIMDTAALNMGIIQRVTKYNSDLLDDELSLMWEQMDLDLLHLHNQRAVERGQIEGQQAASGVVMGQDSHGDVIIDQRAQEAMDALIVRHSADISAAGIANSKAQNNWQGRMEVIKTGYEGQVNAYVTEQNALLQANSTMAQAQSTALQGKATLLGAAIQAKAGKASALQQYQAGMYGANMQYSMNSDKIRSNFVSGMFGAASMGVSNYYQQKPTTMQMPQLGSVRVPTTTTPAYSTAPSTQHQFKSGYTGNYSLATPGSSLAWGL